MNSNIHSKNNRYQCYVTYVSIMFRLLPGLADEAAWILPEEKLWALKGGMATFIPSDSVWLLSQTHLYHVTVGVETDKGIVP